MALPKDNSAKKTLTDEEKEAIQKNTDNINADKKEKDDKEAKEKSQSRKKTGLIAGGSTLALAVIIAGAITVINDPFEWFVSDESGEAVVDETEQVEGQRNSPLVDDSGNEYSAGISFPVEIPDYADRSYRSNDNNQGRDSYLEEWDEWSLPDGFDEHDIDNVEDAEVGSLEGNVYEYNADAGRAVDPRIDDNNSEYNGYQWRDGIEEWARLNVPNLTSASLYFPSRANNYTNNPEYTNLENGELNPLYSYLLAEDIEYFYGQNIQRLLNPVFGDWTYFQSPGNPYGDDINAMPDVLFRHMFTEDWWNNNIVNGDISNLPIMADWGEDNYGGMELVEASSGRWFGEITSHDLTVDIADNGMATIDSSMEIEYISYTDDSRTETVSRTGLLEITIVPNTDTQYDPDRRLLISDVSFSVND